MSETPGASDLLGSGGTAPATADAWKAIAEARSDLRLQDLYRAGDPAARAKMASLERALIGGSNIRADPELSAKFGQGAVDGQKTRSQLEWDNYFNETRLAAEFDPLLEKLVREQAAVTPEQHREAEQIRSQLSRDRGFFEKLQANDREACRKWKVITAYLSLPVARS